MANRIVETVYILDTGSANVSIPMPSNMKVETIRAWFSDTSGKAVFSFSDTSNVFCVLTSQSPLGTGGATDECRLGGINIRELKLPVLTAGTAWVYFS